MSDTKISNLTAGAPAQATDLIPIARSGSNYSLTPANILAYGSSPIVGTQITLNGGSALSSYISSSFTGTLTGCTTAPTGTIYYVKVGDSVTLDSSGNTFTGTSNATTKTITGMPAEIRPTSTKQFLPVVNDNSAGNVVGQLFLYSSGVLDFYITVCASGWTNSGTATISRFSLAYTVN